MPQDPNDPRVQAFYRNQRLQAERGADAGSAKDAATAAKIHGKLGLKSGNFGTNADAQKLRQSDIASEYGVESALGGGAIGKTARNAARAVNAVTRPFEDPSSAGPVLEQGLQGVGHLLAAAMQHAPAAEKFVDHIGKAISRSLFPDADAEVEGAVMKRAKPVNRTLATRAQPVKNVTPKGGAPRTAIGSKKMIGGGAKPSASSTPALAKGRPSPPSASQMKREAAMNKAEKAAQGGRGAIKSVGNRKGIDARPIKSPGRVGDQKALPKPKGDAPKMQHAKVTAGKPRAMQNTARNKGTNPRAQEGYVRGSGKKGYAKGEKAENDPANAPKAKKKAKA